MKNIFGAEMNTEEELEEFLEQLKTPSGIICLIGLILFAIFFFIFI
jgi:hypothetical protein